MENVLIDPTMLMLNDDKEIEDNIDFFRKVISLSNSRQISVCLYKEILDQIMNRQVCPFPININDIKDKKLKEQILLINDAFNNSIMNNYLEIDIDECTGKQDFQTSRKDLEILNEYFALFSMLLTPCYSEHVISEKILVGNKKYGMQRGEHVSITCNCEGGEYNKLCLWAHPDDFLNEQQKALEKLRKCIAAGNLYNKSPEVKKGDHHNHIQNDDFNCYEELSARNKRVLNYLRYLGLYRINFMNFSPDESCEIGTIKISKIKKTSDSDIIIGWLYGCVGFKIVVELYFPKGIGSALNEYVDGELSRMKMEELRTELALF